MSGLAVGLLPQVAVLLAKMEVAGVTFAPAVLSDHRATLAGRLAAIKGRATQLVGYDFNLSSSSQLAQVLYQDLRLAPPAGGECGGTRCATACGRVAQQWRATGPLLLCEAACWLLSALPAGRCVNALLEQSWCGVPLHCLRCMCRAGGGRGAAKTHQSTTEATLKQLAGVHELPGLVLEHRCDWVQETHTQGIFCNLDSCRQHPPVLTSRASGC